MSDRSFAIGVGGAVATALVLGFVDIFDRPLWRDELLTVANAARPLGGFLHEAASEQNGLAFQIVLWPLVHVFGTGEVVVRLVSVLAVAVAVVLCGRLGMRLASQSVGLLAACLLAVNPFVLQYAFDARPYGFVLAFSCASVLLLLRALERPSLLRWILYIASCALLVYSHDFAILSLLAHPVLVWARGSRLARRRYLIAIAGPAVALVPLLVLIPDDWGARAFYWVGFYVGLPREIASEMAGSAAAAVVVALLLVGAAVVVVRRRGQGLELPFPPATAVFVGLWLLVPSVILYLVSFAQPVLVPRYAIQSLPALALAIALALSLLTHRVRALAAVAIGALLLTATVDDLARGRGEQWPAAARLLTTSGSPSDPIVAVGDSEQIVRGLRYYAPQLRLQGMPWWTTPDPQVDGRFRLVEGRGTGVGLERLTAGSEFWIAQSGYLSPEATQRLAQLVGRCSVGAQRGFEGIEISRVGSCDPRSTAQGGSS